jgi:hypothetical protein
MKILYIQHVDTLPSFFPKILDIIAEKGTGLGKKTDKGWIISAASIIHGHTMEAAQFNDFMIGCRNNGYDLFYTTKNPQ